MQLSSVPLGLKTQGSSGGKCQHGKKFSPIPADCGRRLRKVMASRIAAHAGNIVKGVKGAIEKDIAMAKCRKALDWEGQFNLALDPEKARRIRVQTGQSRGKLRLN